MSKPLMRRSIRICISLSRPLHSAFSRQSSSLYPPLARRILFPSRSYSYSSSDKKPSFTATGDDASDSRIVSTSADFDEVSKDELKKRIRKYLEEDNGDDEDAIPSIFEAILSRKLAGKHDDTDEEIIGELGPREEVDFEETDDDEFASSDDD